MMNQELLQRLAAWRTANPFRTQGPLSVALVITDQARRQGLPLEPDSLITQSPRGGGQVAGLSGPAVEKILSRHGIERALAKEGGRTSRGSIANMRAYVALLNELHRDGQIDLDAIELFWIGAVQAFFAGKPFLLKRDVAQGLRTLVRGVLAQAEKRQKEAGGMQYVGAVLQHLIGAKLQCALPDMMPTHHSFTTADAPSGRAGDFLLGDVAIHVTTAPGEAVIERCKLNVENGLRPMLVTLKRGVAVAEGLAENAGLADRIDVFEAEQFIALNLYELGRFAAAGRDFAIIQLVERYNGIIDAHETDPSLRIEIDS